MRKMAILTCALACMAIACQSNGSETVSSLKRTTWKLVGFVNVASGEVKEAEPASENCYLLSFNEDSTLSGTSSSNQLAGTYVFDEKKSSIHINIHQATLVTEAFDGNQYLDALNVVQSFLLHKDELRLYYNDQKEYLFFKLQKS